MLCFRGGHVLGSGTIIVATWRSPFTDPSRYPSLHMDALIDTVNPLADIHLLFEERSQYAGGRWTRWGHWPPIVFNAGTYGGGGDADATLIPDAPARARFEWRLTLTIVAPATLDGDVVLTVPAKGVRTPLP